MLLWKDGVVAKAGIGKGITPGPAHLIPSWGACQHLGPLNGLPLALGEDKKGPRCILPPTQFPISPAHSYVHVYRELEQAIRGADAQDDLRWFRSTSGPGMPMNWPQFEVRRCGDGEGKFGKTWKGPQGAAHCSPGAH